MSEKMETGAQGEAIAAEYFVNLGYEVVARNYRNSRGEIDLIVKRDNWVLFIEVKTRQGTAYGQPEQFVSSAQMQRIYSCAENWIFEHNWKGQIRFDILAIVLGEPPEITHFPDAIN